MAVQLPTVACARFIHETTNQCAFFWQNCHFLEKMDLEDCVAISDSTLAALAQYCPRLETLVRERENRVAVVGLVTFIHAGSLQYCADQSPF